MTQKQKLAKQHSAADLAFLASPEFKERVHLIREVLQAVPASAVGAVTEFVQRHKGHRGRRARKYLAATRVVRGVNETVAAVFEAIREGDGKTQVDLQNELKLPHSTVWYALKKLRRQKAIHFNKTQSA